MRCQPARKALDCRQPGLHRSGRLALGCQVAGVSVYPIGLDVSQVDKLGRVHNLANESHRPRNVVICPARCHHAGFEVGQMLGECPPASVRQLLLLGVDDAAFP
jgi:hypothetical protein